MEATQEGQKIERERIKTAADRTILLYNSRWILHSGHRVEIPGRSRSNSQADFGVGLAVQLWHDLPGREYGASGWSVGHHGQADPCHRRVLKSFWDGASLADPLSL